MQEEMLARGRELADRVNDMNPLIDAAEDRFDQMEVLVPMWMGAATSQDVIDRLERETGFTHRQVKRWEHMLRNRENSEIETNDPAVDLEVATIDGRSWVLGVGGWAPPPNAGADHLLRNRGI